MSCGQIGILRVDIVVGEEDFTELDLPLRERRVRNGSFEFLEFLLNKFLLIKPYRSGS